MQSAAALGGPRWLRSLREDAASRFEAASLPHTGLEDWRYSRIDGLDLERYSPVTERPAGSVQADPAVDALVSSLGADVTRIDTLDGWVAGGTAARGVTLELPANAAGEPEGIDDLAGEPDAFAVANRAFAPEPVVVRVERAAAAAPVVIVHWCAGDDTAVFPRVHVQAGEGSRVTVMEVVAGPGRCLVAPVTEIDVQRAASVSYVHVQVLAERAWQIALQASRVATEGDLLSAAVALGGDYARLRTASSLVGTGGATRLLAMYFGAGTQMHDFRTVQDHRAPKSRSDLLYKGVVANQARSVYSGLIRVEKGARGTSAFQTNRNLVLHEGAHADSVPNLEIEDNDVRCSHASAVGPVAEDQRFYLESRGVPPEVSDRLIALGFLEEVVEQLPLPGAGPALGPAIAAKLEQAEERERSR